VRRSDVPGVKRALSHWQGQRVELLLLMVGNGSGEPGEEDHSRVGMFAHRMGPHRKPLSGARQDRDPLLLACTECQLREGERSGAG
jgi:hypothetical protein